MTEIWQSGSYGSDDYNVAGHIDEMAVARARALAAHRPHGNGVPDHIALSVGDVRDVHRRWWTELRRGEADARSIVEANGLTATFTPVEPDVTRVTIEFPALTSRMELAEYIRTLQSPADVRLHDARRWRPEETAP